VLEAGEVALRREDVAFDEVHIDGGAHDVTARSRDQKL
jgi:hypothetical protein